MERVYAERSQGTTPLDYPSLDVPYYNNAVNRNLKAEPAEKLASDPAVVTAANQIVAACGQLAASVHRPFFSLMEGLMSGHIVASIQFLEATNTVEILREAGPEGVHVNELARRIDVLASDQDGTASAEPVDPDKLGHILRLLATFHWIREVRPDVFANNRLSSIIDSGKTPEQLRIAPSKKYDGTDCVAALVPMKSDDFFKSIAHMTDALLPDRERAISLRKLLYRRGQSDSATNVKYKTPFNLAFRTELGYFEWLELPENKTRLRDFGVGMTGTRPWEIVENIIGTFAWKDLSKDSVVVDVGGGVGSTSVVLAHAYPHLRFVVEDRKQVVEIAPSVWSGEHAELVKSGRVSFRPQDFLQPRPPSIEVPVVGSVSSPAVFLIRGCTHNWPDESVRTILRHLRNAAGSTTKLLIVDMVLAHACYDDYDDGREAIPGAERTLAPEGSPLLANLGRASASGYLLDLSMMAVLGAKERTLREISALALSAGWKVSRMVRASGSVWAYISAEPF
ncbi:S-adenosyl-L-methionine-dependent methyltransferase [Dichomitus squalens]|uniref:S-adenosyl-L-methionine-dependent methyltransferase n=1 Tax=Dichomitus squalens TaxID=114155 RepID=A0A4Q9MCG2_9APHY|nr:S-adenosyl-L-methionine-dependent methyltransferase [Dichomitus squalens]